MPKGTRKYSNKDLHLEIFSSDPDNPKLQQFWKIRYRIFSEMGKDFYKNEKPESYDIHPDTVFILVAGPDGQVLGGRRILIRDPNSKEPLVHLKTEKTIPIPLSLEFAHLPVSKLKCAEFGSLCFDESIRGKDENGESYLPYFYKESFRFAIEKELQIIISETIPTNFGNFFKAAKTYGMKQLYLIRSMLLPDNKETKDLLGKIGFVMVTDEEFNIDDPRISGVASDLINSQSARENGPVRGIKVKSEDKNWIFLSVFSTDGYFDVRTITSPLSDRELSLLTSEMARLGIGKVYT